MGQARSVENRSRAGAGAEAVRTWTILAPAAAKPLKMRLLVVSADGKETDLPALKAFLSQLGIPFTTLIATESDLTAVLSQSAEERHAIMRLMLGMAMANGHLNPPELRYVQAIANKLEIGRDGLEELRKEVKAMTAASEEPAPN